MKAIQAKVISDKMQKTAVVSQQLIRRHPVYGKVMRKSRKLHVENLIGAKVGDLVEIVPTKKLSKTKAHKITKIIES